MMASHTRSLAALFLVLFALQAATPLASSLPSRKLLGGRCGQGISLGGVQAFSFPHLGFIGGTCIIKNNRPRPFSLNGGAFALRGPQKIHGGLRCPQPIIPAGGELRCGFVAPHDNPAAFNGFAPLFGAGGCGGNNFFPITPVAGPRPASADAAASATAAAVGQAFGAPAAAKAQSAAAAQGAAASPFGIADGVAADLFGQAFSNSEAIAKQNGWGDAVAAASSTSTSNGFGGAGSRAVGRAFSQFGAAAGRADSVALGGAGPAAAGAKAVGVSQFGPASAGSSSLAAGAVADANSKSVALCGNGPCSADSKAVAAGQFGANANTKSVAVNNGHGPAVATASSVATSGR